jgi:glycosyltransferase involved in cell wall biosynthesis
MRVLQVPFTFHPDAMGGTEVYVAALSHALAKQNIESIIAAPADVNTTYSYGTLPVHRFAVGKPTLAQVYGEGDPIAATNFGVILDTVRPHVVHFHAHTSAVSRLAVQEAKIRGHKVVFTYHTPTVSCSRGTMMLFGKTPCDGLLKRQRCAACTAHAQGVPSEAAHLLGWLPPQIGSFLAKNRGKGGLWTALQLSSLMDVKHRAVQEIFAVADRIVAVCKWIQDLLQLNKVPFAKVVLNRQGLPYQTELLKSPQRPTSSDTEKTIRLLFLGRLDPVKGIEIAIEAIRHQPTTIPITFDIYGVTQAGGDTYRQHLQTLADDDHRIRFYAPVAPEVVVPLMQGYDGLLVPSTWLETGPLVVLEAFAAGIPVLGSCLGGIAELVTDEGDGLLIAPNDVDAWTKAITWFTQDGSLRQRLTQGVRPPRTTTQVADEMEGLYRELVGYER